jgi:D-glycero-alpha-D-manno-heptose 1-phosphate guanylyltransferase
MQAIILAGGRGTRLRGVLGNCPKPLAPVCGRPFLAHLLEQLDREAVRSVVLAVGYHACAIKRAFGKRYGGVSIAYSDEAVPLGTGGAIRKALTVTQDFPCFVVNGDTWPDLDYAAMFNHFRATGADISMSVKRVGDVGRYGSIVIRDGRIVGFQEKSRAGAGYINSGIYLLRHGLLDSYDVNMPFSFEQDFIQLHLRRLTMVPFKVEGRFIDIGVPQDYRKVELMLRGGTV